MEDPQKKSLRLVLLHRLFADSNKGYRVKQLSERLGVTERTIQRDIAELEVPPYSLPLKKDGWFYQLDRTAAVPLPPITLSQDQAAALFIGARLLSQYSGSLAPLADDAVAKLAEALPAELGVLLLRSIQTQPDLVRSNSEVVFSTLVAGWKQRRLVECVHQTLGGKTSTYYLAPYTFEPSAVGYAIYVRGRCEDDRPGQLRTLKLDRIRQATLTETRFEITAEQDTTLNNAWRIWGSDEEPVEVRLRFTARVTARVKETRWHPEQQIEDREGGGCEWQALVAEPQEMLPWIRGWGAECEVLAPQKIRNDLIREARKLARLYGVAEVSSGAKKSAEAADEISEDERINRLFNDVFGG